AAVEDLATTCLDLVDGPLVAGDRALIDHRAHPVLGLGRITDRDLGGPLHEPVDEVVVHRLLHVDPGGGRALLTAEAEGGAGDAFDRGVDVGAGGDDHRVLAAHLGHDGLGAGLVGGPVDAHSDVIGPGE